MLWPPFCTECYADRDIEWLPDHDTFVALGLVRCPRCYRDSPAGLIQNVADDPPVHCPFSLEHMNATELEKGG